MPSNILIIGKIPPPAGGIGIHVERLMEKLRKDNFCFLFFDLRHKPIYLIPYYIYKNDIIHIHVSNSYLRLILIIISRILIKKTIFTFHGNVGRFNKLRNSIDMLSFKFTNIGIVINKDSYLKVKNYQSSQMITAFLPPYKVNPLPFDMKLKVESFTKRYKRVFCTNAHGMSFDKNNREIYGILGLIRTFEKLSDFGLIISDSMGTYLEYFQGNTTAIPVNVLLLNDKHDFVNIIQISDAFIRATTTDGDSLSVKESLYYGKCTICSDSVDRAEGVILFETENWTDLKNKLENIRNWHPTFKPESGYPQLIKLYNGK